MSKIAHLPSQMELLLSQFRVTNASHPSYSKLLQELHNAIVSVIQLAILHAADVSNLTDAPCPLCMWTRISSAVEDQLDVSYAGIMEVDTPTCVIQDHSIQFLSCRNGLVSYDQNACQRIPESFFETEPPTAFTRPLPSGDALFTTIVAAMATATYYAPHTHRVAAHILATSPLSSTKSSFSPHTTRAILSGAWQGALAFLLRLHRLTALSAASVAHLLHMTEPTASSPHWTDLELFSSPFSTSLPTTTATVDSTSPLPLPHCPSNPSSSTPSHTLSPTAALAPALSSALGKSSPVLSHDPFAPVFAALAQLYSQQHMAQLVQATHSHTATADLDDLSMGMGQGDGTGVASPPLTSALSSSLPRPRAISLGTAIDDITLPSPPTSLTATGKERDRVEQDYLQYVPPPPPSFPTVSPLAWACTHLGLHEAVLAALHAMLTSIPTADTHTYGFTQTPAHPLGNVYECGTVSMGVDHASPERVVVMRRERERVLPRVVAVAGAQTDMFGTTTTTTPILGTDGTGAGASAAADVSVPPVVVVAHASTLSPRIAPSVYFSFTPPRLPTQSSTSSSAAATTDSSTAATHPSNRDPRTEASRREAILRARLFSASLSSTPSEAPPVAAKLTRWLDATGYSYSSWVRLSSRSQDAVLLMRVGACEDAVEVVYFPHTHTLSLRTNLRYFTQTIAQEMGLNVPAEANARALTVPGVVIPLNQWTHIAVTHSSSAVRNPYHGLTDRVGKGEKKSTGSRLLTWGLTKLKHATKAVEKGLDKDKGGEGDVSGGGSMGAEKASEKVKGTHAAPLSPRTQALLTVPPHADKATAADASAKSSHPTDVPYPASEDSLCVYVAGVCVCAVGLEYLHSVTETARTTLMSALDGHGAGLLTGSPTGPPPASMGTGAHSSSGKGSSRGHTPSPFSSPSAASTSTSAAMRETPLSSLSLAASSPPPVPAASIPPSALMQPYYLRCILSPALLSAHIPDGALASAHLLSTLLSPAEVHVLASLSPAAHAAPQLLPLARAQPPPARSGSASSSSSSRETIPPDTIAAFPPSPVPPTPVLHHVAAVHVLEQHKARPGMVVPAPYSPLGVHSPFTDFVSVAPETRKDISREFRASYSGALPATIEEALSLAAQVPPPFTFTSSTLTRTETLSFIQLAVLVAPTTPPAPTPDSPPVVYASVPAVAGAPASALTYVLMKLAPGLRCEGGVVSGADVGATPVVHTTSTSTVATAPASAAVPHAIPPRGAPMPFSCLSSIETRALTHISLLTAIALSPSYQLLLDLGPVFLFKAFLAPLPRHARSPAIAAATMRLLASLRARAVADRTAFIDFLSVFILDTSFWCDLPAHAIDALALFASITISDPLFSIPPSRYASIKSSTPAYIADSISVTRILDAVRVLHAPHLSRATTLFSPRTVAVMSSTSAFSSNTPSHHEDTEDIPSDPRALLTLLHSLPAAASLALAATAVANELASHPPLASLLSLWIPAPDIKLALEALAATSPTSHTPSHAPASALPIVHPFFSQADIVPNAQPVALPDFLSAVGAVCPSPALLTTVPPFALGHSHASVLDQGVSGHHPHPYVHAVHSPHGSVHSPAHAQPIHVAHNGDILNLHPPSILSPTRAHTHATSSCSDSAPPLAPAPLTLAPLTLENTVAARTLLGLLPRLIAPRLARNSESVGDCLALFAFIADCLDASKGPAAAHPLLAAAMECVLEVVDLLGPASLLSVLSTRQAQRVLVRVLTFTPILPSDHCPILALRIFAAHINALGHSLQKKGARYGHVDADVKALRYVSDLATGIAHAFLLSPFNHLQPYALALRLHAALVGPGAAASTHREVLYQREMVGTESNGGSSSSGARAAFSSGDFPHGNNTTGVGAGSGENGVGAGTVNSVVSPLQHAHPLPHSPLSPFPSEDDDDTHTPWLLHPTASRHPTSSLPAPHAHTHTHGTPRGYGLASGSMHASTGRNGATHGHSETSYAEELVPASGYGDIISELTAFVLSDAYSQTAVRTEVTPVSVSDLNAIAKAAHVAVQQGLVQSAITVSTSTSTSPAPARGSMSGGTILNGSSKAEEAMDIFGTRTLTNAAAAGDMALPPVDMNIESTSTASTLTVNTNDAIAVSDSPLYLLSSSLSLSDCPLSAALTALHARLPSLVLECALALGMEPHPALVKLVERIEVANSISSLQEAQGMRGNSSGIDVASTNTSSPTANITSCSGGALTPAQLAALECFLAANPSSPSSSAVSAAAAATSPPASSLTITRTMAHLRSPSLASHLLVAPASPHLLLPVAIMDALSDLVTGVSTYQPSALLPPTHALSIITAAHTLPVRATSISVITGTAQPSTAPLSVLDHHSADLIAADAFRRRALSPVFRAATASAISTTASPSTSTAASILPLYIWSTASLLPPLSLAGLSLLSSLPVIAAAQASNVYYADDIAAVAEATASAVHEAAAALLHERRRTQDANAGLASPSPVHSPSALTAALKPTVLPRRPHPSILSPLSALAHTLSGASSPTPFSPTLPRSLAPPPTSPSLDAPLATLGPALLSSLLTTSIRATPQAQTLLLTKLLSLSALSYPDLAIFASTAWHAPILSLALGASRATLSPRRLTVAAHLHALTHASRSSRPRLLAQALTSLASLQTEEDMSRGYALHALVRLASALLWVGAENSSQGASSLDAWLWASARAYAHYDTALGAPQARGHALAVMDGAQPQLPMHTPAHLRLNPLFVPVDVPVPQHNPRIGNYYGFDDSGVDSGLPRAVSPRAGGGLGKGFASMRRSSTGMLVSGGMGLGMGMGAVEAMSTCEPVPVNADDVLYDDSFVDRYANRQAGETASPRPAAYASRRYNHLNANDNMSTNTGMYSNTTDTFDACALLPRDPLTSAVRALALDRDVTRDHAHRGPGEDTDLSNDDDDDDDDVLTLATLEEDDELVLMQSQGSVGSHRGPYRIGPGSLQRPTSTSVSKLATQRASASHPSQHSAATQYTGATGADMVPGAISLAPDCYVRVRRGVALFTQTSGGEPSSSSPPLALSPPSSSATATVTTTSTSTPGNNTSTSTPNSTTVPLDASLKGLAHSLLQHYPESLTDTPAAAYIRARALAPPVPHPALALPTSSLWTARLAVLCQLVRQSSATLPALLSMDVPHTVVHNNAIDHPGDTISPPTLSPLSYSLYKIAPSALTPATYTSAARRDFADRVWSLHMSFLTSDEDMHVIRYSALNRALHTDDVEVDSESITMANELRLAAAKTLPAHAQTLCTSIPGVPAMSAVQKRRVAHGLGRILEHAEHLLFTHPCSAFARHRYSASSELDAGAEEGDVQRPLPPTHMEMELMLWLIVSVQTLHSSAAHRTTAIRILTRVAAVVLPNPACHPLILPFCLVAHQLMLSLLVRDSDTFDNSGRLVRVQPEVAHPNDPNTPPSPPPPPTVPFDEAFIRNQRVVAALCYTVYIAAASLEETLPAMAKAHQDITAQTPRPTPEVNYFTCYLRKLAGRPTDDVFGEVSYPDAATHRAVQLISPLHALVACATQQWGLAGALPAATVVASTSTLPFAADDHPEGPAIMSEDSPTATGLANLQSRLGLSMPRKASVTLASLLSRPPLLSAWVFTVPAVLETLRGVLLPASSLPRPVQGLLTAEDVTGASVVQTWLLRAMSSEYTMVLSWTLSLISLQILATDAALTERAQQTASLARRTQAQRALKTVDAAEAFARADAQLWGVHPLQSLAPASTIEQAALLLSAAPEHGHTKPCPVAAAREYLPPLGVAEEMLGLLRERGEGGARAEEVFEKEGAMLRSVLTSTPALTHPTIGTYTLTFANNDTKSNNSIAGNNSPNDAFTSSTGAMATALSNSMSTRSLYAVPLPMRVLSRYWLHTRYLREECYAFHPTPPTVLYTPQYWHTSGNFQNFGIFRKSGVDSLPPSPMLSLMASPPPRLTRQLARSISSLKAIAVEAIIAGTGALLPLPPPLTPPPVLTQRVETDNFAPYAHVPPLSALLTSPSTSSTPLLPYSPLHAYVTGIPTIATPEPMPVHPARMVPRPLLAALLLQAYRILAQRTGQNYVDGTVGDVYHALGLMFSSSVDEEGSGNGDKVNSDALPVNIKGVQLAMHVLARIGFTTAHTNTTEPTPAASAILSSPSYLGLVPSLADCHTGTWVITAPVVAMDHTEYPSGTHKLTKLPSDFQSALLAVLAAANPLGTDKKALSAAVRRLVQSGGMLPSTGREKDKEKDKEGEATAQGQGRSQGQAMLLLALAAAQGEGGAEEESLGEADALLDTISEGESKSTGRLSTDGEVGGMEVGNVNLEASTDATEESVEAAFGRDAVVAVLTAPAHTITEEEEPEDESGEEVSEMKEEDERVHLSDRPSAPSLPDTPSMSRGSDADSTISIPDIVSRSPGHTRTVSSSILPTEASTSRSVATHTRSASASLHARPTIASAPAVAPLAPKPTDDNSLTDVQAAEARRRQPATLGAEAVVMITPKRKYAGVLVLTATSLSFTGKPVIDTASANLHQMTLAAPTPDAKVKSVRWSIRQISKVIPATYMLRPNALEVYTLQHRSYFFTFLHPDNSDKALWEQLHRAQGREDLIQRRDACIQQGEEVPYDIWGTLPRDFQPRRLALRKQERLARNAMFAKLCQLLGERPLIHPVTRMQQTGLTQRWVRGEISNFDYLISLNAYAGRTFNDLAQYPVFPWIIADYTSSSLNLADPSVYRDLSKPVGALNPDRLDVYLERYHEGEETGVAPFMYGTHYSSLGIVLYYLIRSLPHTVLNAEMQGTHFDHPDRLFASMQGAWHSALHSLADVKELIPEFYSYSGFLTNINGADLGVNAEGIRVGDVVLPPWATSPAHFTATLRAALESPYVSERLHHWIDLIFGYKQQGRAAVSANNVFVEVTYPSRFTLDSIADAAMRRAAEDQVAFFGQTPVQLFIHPHPQRLAPEARPAPTFSVEYPLRDPLWQRNFASFFERYSARRLRHGVSSVMHGSSDNTTLSTADSTHITTTNTSHNTISSPVLPHHGMSINTSRARTVVTSDNVPDVSFTEDFAFSSSTLTTSGSFPNDAAACANADIGHRGSVPPPPPPEDAFDAHTDAKTHASAGVGAAAAAADEDEDEFTSIARTTAFSPTRSSLGSPRPTSPHPSASLSPVSGSIFNPPASLSLEQLPQPIVPSASSPSSPSASTSGSIAPPQLLPRGLSVSIPVADKEDAAPTAEATLLSLADDLQPFLFPYTSPPTVPASLVPPAIHSPALLPALPDATITTTTAKASSSPPIRALDFSSSLFDAFPADANNNAASAVPAASALTTPAYTPPPTMPALYRSVLARYPIPEDDSPALKPTFTLITRGSSSPTTSTSPYTSISADSAGGSVSPGYHAVDVSTDAHLDYSFRTLLCYPNVSPTASLPPYAPSPRSPHTPRLPTALAVTPSHALIAIAHTPAGPTMQVLSIAALMEGSPVPLPSWAFAPDALAGTLSTSATTATGTVGRASLVSPRSLLNRAKTPLSPTRGSPRTSTIASEPAAPCYTPTHPAPLLTSDFLRSLLPPWAAPLAASASGHLARLSAVVQVLGRHGWRYSIGFTTAPSTDKHSSKGLSTISSPSRLPLALHPLHPCFVPVPSSLVTPPIPLSSLCAISPVAPITLSRSARLLAVPAATTPHIHVFTVNPMEASARWLFALPTASSAPVVCLALAPRHATLCAADAHGIVSAWKLPAEHLSGSNALSSRFMPIPQYSHEKHIYDASMPSSAPPPPASAPAPWFTLALPSPPSALAVHPTAGYMLALCPSPSVLGSVTHSHARPSRITAQPLTSTCARALPVHSLTITPHVHASSAAPASTVSVISLRRAALSCSFLLPADLQPEGVAVTPNGDVLVYGTVMVDLTFATTNAHASPNPYTYNTSSTSLHTAPTRWTTCTRAVGAAALLYTPTGQLIARRSLPARITSVHVTSPTTTYTHGGSVYIGLADGIIATFSADDLTPHSVFSTFGPPPHCLPPAAHAAMHLLMRRTRCAALCAVCVPDLTTVGFTHTNNNNTNVNNLNSAVSGSSATSDTMGVTAVTPTAWGQHLIVAAGLPYTSPYTLADTIASVATNTPLAACSLSSTLPLPPSLLVPTNTHRPVDPYLLALCDTTANHVLVPTDAVACAIASAASLVASQMHETQGPTIFAHAITDKPDVQHVYPKPTAAPGSLAAAIAALAPPPPIPPRPELLLCSIAEVTVIAALACALPGKFGVDTLHDDLQVTEALHDLLQRAQATTVQSLAGEATGGRLLIFPLRTSVAHPYNLGFFSREMGEAVVEQVRAQWNAKQESDDKQRTKHERDVVSKLREQEERKTKGSGILSWFK